VRETLRLGNHRFKGYSSGMKVLFVQEQIRTVISLGKIGATLVMSQPGKSMQRSKSFDTWWCMVPGFIAGTAAHGEVGAV